MKKKKRILLPTILFLIFCIAAGWFGWRWYDENIDRSGWLEQDGIYYYQDFHANKVTSWQHIGDRTYYFAEDFRMVTGWQAIDGSRYYFDEAGTLKFGWQDIGGHRYYLGSTGQMVTGWQTIDGARYYFYPDGTMASGLTELEGKQYCFTYDGDMVTGWYTDGETLRYFGQDGAAVTGEVILEGQSYLFREDGSMVTGWVDRAQGRCYYGSDGAMVTGWQTIDGKRYFFGDEGFLATGWLTQGEYRYYLLPDGAAAVGKQEIDGEIHYFSPKGIDVLLVNYENAVPDWYDTDLVTFSGWSRVSAVAKEPLRQMMEDCKAAGIQCYLNCGYRSVSEQTQILDQRTAEYQDKGMSFAAARNKALETVAIPNFSEHHTGLAMDVVCNVETDWLIENCWRYGFILRYPPDKKDITHIVYEFWHFRYVGTEVSMDMKDSGLCLEEYLGAV